MVGRPVDRVGDDFTVPKAQPKEGDGMADYAGDLSPRESWRLLGEDPRAVLIDVRTQPEWAFVGLPDLGSLGKNILGLMGTSGMYVGSLGILLSRFVCVYLIKSNC